jgi:hypothetical protein
MPGSKARAAAVAGIVVLGCAACDATVGEPPLAPSDRDSTWNTVSFDYTGARQGNFALSEPEEGRPVLTSRVSASAWRSWISIRAFAPPSSTGGGAAVLALDLPRNADGGWSGTYRSTGLPYWEGYVGFRDGALFWVDPQEWWTAAGQAQTHLVVTLDHPVTGSGAGQRVSGSFEGRLRLADAARSDIIEVSNGRFSVRIW